MTYGAFLNDLDPIQSELFIYLDKLILGTEGTSNKMRFKIPFYDNNSWFCYLNPVKSTHVDFCFLKGKEMKTTFDLLDLRNRKMVSSILIDVNSEIPEKLLIDMINHAIGLNK